MATKMSSKNVGMLGALLGALGCGGTSQGKAAATPTTQRATTSVSAPRAAVPSDCKPLQPPPSRELPEALKKALPRDREGRPVIAQQGGLGLVYDSKLNDPITRWGACLSRVLAVKTANPGAGMLSHCIDLMEVCPTDEGGDDCCPQACR